MGSDAADEARTAPAGAQAEAASSAAFLPGMLEKAKHP